MKSNSILAVIILISFFGVSSVRADENMQTTVEMPSGKVALKYWLDRAADRKALLDGFKTLENPATARLARWWNSCESTTDIIVTKIQEKYADCPSITLDDAYMLKGNFEKINKFLIDPNNQECLRTFKCTPQEKNIVTTTMQTVYQNAKNQFTDIIKIPSYGKQFEKISPGKKYYWHSWHLVPELDRQVVHLQKEDPVYQNCQNPAFAKNNAHDCQRNAAFYWYLSGVCMETNEKRVKEEYMNQSVY